jgi:spore cortex biosynthesis protein YabQ
MLIQVREFLLTVGIGLILAGIFHFHQKCVKHFPIRGILLWLFDLGVWLVVVPLVFAGLLIINQGEVRFYVLLALLVGAGLYMVYVRPKFNRPIEVAAGYTVKTARFVFSAIAVSLRRLRFWTKTPPPPGDDELEC